jgi:hypothetical protein
MEMMIIEFPRDVNQPYASPRSRSRHKREKAKDIGRSVITRTSQLRIRKGSIVTRGYVMLLGCPDR